MSAEVFDLVPMDQAPNRIRAHRMRAGLSQQALADKLGVSKVTISSLECGRMQLSLDYMKRLAAALGLPPVDLLLEDEQNSFLREEEMDLIRAYRAAGEFQRELIQRVAEQRSTYDTQGAGEHGALSVAAGQDNGRPPGAPAPRKSNAA
jgi:transcriptional regulator with XRE-family HTH domain